ncbi:MAG: substrate-binding domain-containing protein [Bifidobacterium sp.]|uniref:Substrate-binding domain-containing protein n=1 Tax=Bifidobacterium fermentum TaxID=3059035 RepID=A0AB39UJ17_9BIFI
MADSPTQQSAHGSVGKAVALVAAAVVVIALVIGAGWLIKGRQATASAEGTSASAKPVIAVSARTTDSDYYIQWLNGVKKEAARIGATLKIYDANGDDSQQILDIESATALKPAAILVDHALEGINPNVKKALNAGIPVVGFDSDITDSRAISVSQSDEKLAKLATDRLLKDTGGKATVIYTYVAGFAPLDARNKVWTSVKKANPGIKQVAQVGVVNDSTAQQTAEQVKAALQAHPDTTVVFAPYDEFAKGATQAVEELGLTSKVKVYGVDISDADIAVLGKTNSPWVLTATTDPSNVGAVAIRTAFRAAEKKQTTKSVLIPPALVTADEIRKYKITSVSQLVKHFPSLVTDSISPVASAN